MYVCTYVGYINAGRTTASHKWHDRTATVCIFIRAHVCMYICTYICLYVHMTQAYSHCCWHRKISLANSCFLVYFQVQFAAPTPTHIHTLSCWWYGAHAPFSLALLCFALLLLLIVTAAIRNLLEFILIFSFPAV